MTADLVPLIVAKVDAAEAALDAAPPVEWTDNLPHYANTAVAALIVLAVNGLRAQIAATRETLARHVGERGCRRYDAPTPATCCAGCGFDSDQCYRYALADCPEIAIEARRWGVDHGE